MARDRQSSESQPDEDRLALLSPEQRVDRDGINSDAVPDARDYDHGRQFTVRGILVGCLVGTVLAAVNVYFGLQTGWVSLMSMPASLLSFVIFKAISQCLSFPFEEKENVFVQTVAVAVGCMSLSAGLVGLVPAIEKLLVPAEGGPILLSTSTLIIWSLGLAFFGVIFSVPLRKQVIIREKLRFPSGTATATMISILHKGQAQVRVSEPSGRRASTSQDEERPQVSGEPAGSPSYDWQSQTRILSVTFALSAFYTILTFFFPILRNLPAFGSDAATTWLWTVNPSPAYIGQGMIMGQSTTLAMLFGAIIGWGILSPIAKTQGWAPGPVSNWKTGSRGWIVWVSLAIMLADSVVSLSLFAWDTIAPTLRKQLSHNRWVAKYASRFINVDATDDESHEASDIDEDAPLEHQVDTKTFIATLLLSTLLCIGTIRYCFPQVPIYLTVVALLMAFLLSVMAVRALGQTDLNPVSGISKIAQLFFAIIVPKSSSSAVLVNLVAGAISEAAGQQAGDIMQGLKAAHLLHASPKVQFHGQLIGAAYGAVISSLIYKLYDKVYKIPGNMFEIPAAVVWIDCSRLLYGEGLPKYAQEFCIVFGLVFAVITAVKSQFGTSRLARFLPGGIAVAIGMYNTPSFTLARVIGGLAEGYWRRRARNAQASKDRETELILVASGAIIGEGIASLVNLGLTIMTAGKSD